MKRKSLLRKLSFASADLFGGGSFNIINFLYPGFLALVVGINPFWASFIMMTARVFDAVIDPIIGWISDATSSRFGKRRIFLIVCSPLIALGMFLLFYPFSFPDMTMRIISVLVSYLIFVSIQSSVMIPYYSLSSEISSDYQDRASFNSYRLGFSIFASIICVAVPGIIVNSFGTTLQAQRVGYQIMSITFGIFFGFSILISGLFAKEEITSPPIKRKVSVKNFFEPLELKPFRQYLGMFLFLQIAMAVMSGLFFFYIDFYVVKDVTASGSANSVGLIAAALLFLTQIFALPFYLQMIKRKSKAFTYRFGAYIWILAAIALFFIPPNISPIFIYLLAVIMGFGISAPGLVPHTMFGDIVDFGHIKFGKRLEGAMAGFMNFANQIAQAIGLAFAMMILGFAGFQERDIRLPDPVLSQPESALLAIRLLLLLTPVILLGLGSIISFRYKIDASEHEKIKQQIAELSIQTLE
jgi:oligogalacturonide transporter